MAAPASGWVALPVLRQATNPTVTHASWIRTTARGNVELAVDLTAELAAVRQQRGTTTKPTGPIAKGEAPEAERQRAYREAYRGLLIPGAPTGRPTPPAALAGPETEAESLSVLRRQLARTPPPSSALPYYGVSVPLGMKPVPTVLPPAPQVGEPRRDIRVFLIPAEALVTFRRYRIRLQQTPSRDTQQEIIVGAAYALYTSKIGALPVGVRVTPTMGGGLVFTPAAELPGQGIRASAQAPGFGLPPEFGTELPIGAQTPVFYESVLALLFAVLGPLRLYKNGFDNLMQQAGWYPEGHLLGSNINVLRPPVKTPRPPPAARFTFGEPVQQPFPQHERARPAGAPGPEQGRLGV